MSVVKKTLTINPQLLVSRKKDLERIYNSIKNREQGTIFEEVLKDDRKELDLILLETLGLGKSELKELYQESVNFVQERKDKSKSVITTKSKRSLSYMETFKLVNDRYSEVSRYSKLLKGLKTKPITIPFVKGRYSKDMYENTQNMFNEYNVAFIDGKIKTIVKLETLNQLKLFHFLNETLEFKGAKIEVPTGDNDCKDILNLLKRDYNDNIHHIKVWLKSIRNKSNPLSLYRDVVMSE